MQKLQTESRVDTMFRAFSDRTRLRILLLLRRGEMCVGDIVAVLQAAQPRVSQHLSYLRKAGLVVARKEGLWNFYSLARSQNSFHANLLGFLDACARHVPEIRADEQRAEKLRKSDGCCPR